MYIGMFSWWVSKSRMVEIPTFVEIDYEIISMAIHPALLI